MSTKSITLHSPEFNKLDGTTTQYITAIADCAADLAGELNCLADHTCLRVRSKRVISCADRGCFVGVVTFEPPLPTELPLPV